MNSNLLPLSLIAAVGLLIIPQTSQAAICTFDVDDSSGIGSGSFTIDLPELWPPPPLIFGQVRTTVIPASSVRGFFARGDKWIALSVSLNTFLEQANSAELSGGCKKAGTFRTPPSVLGLTPIEAVANLPGVTLRPSSAAPSELSRQRRSRLLEKNILLKSGSDQSRQKPRLTSGTFSTDLVVDAAASVLSSRKRTESTHAAFMRKRVFGPAQLS